MREFPNGPSDSTTSLVEMNIDAVVGPSHHFGGLGVGNLASQQHQRMPSNPREAALQGLAKAEVLAELGIPQFMWLPPDRPRWEFLQQLGFSGSQSDQIRRALDVAPQVVSAAFSGAFMWAANSATFTPAVDASDGRDHVTPANLVSSWHRSSEASERMLDLSQFTRSLPACVMHRPLPAIFPLRDEGAANHMRLCDAEFQSGFHIFVYAADEQAEQPIHFLPRQSQAACRAIARLHCLDERRTFFLKQHPKAVDAGVFHNDVIATSHQHLLLHHELAFDQAESELGRLESDFHKLAGMRLHRIEISHAELPLEDAVKSYFFNSQLVTPQVSGSDGGMVMVCPMQCSQITAAKTLIDRLLADNSNPIQQVRFVSLDESMAGGGGPACLRLRMCVARKIVNAIEPRLRATPENLERLRGVIRSEYPSSCDLTRFADPAFVEQVVQATRKLRSAALAR
ncbi:MAG: N-succinylarginine dihydrolase [bacterium]|nr:N-succinylarginine dihydrolase [bacterium]